MFFRRGRVLWLPVSAQEIPADIEPLWTDMLSVGSAWLTLSPLEAGNFLRREKILPFVLSNGVDQWEQWIACTVARSARTAVQIAFTKETRRRLLEARESDHIANRSINKETISDSKEKCTQTDPVLILNPPGNLMGSFSFEELGGYLTRKLDVLRLFSSKSVNFRSPQIDHYANRADSQDGGEPVGIGHPPGPVPLFGAGLTQSEPDPEETPRSLEISLSEGAVSEGGEEVRVEEVLVTGPEEIEDERIVSDEIENDNELGNNSTLKWETGSMQSSVYGGRAPSSLGTGSRAGSFVGSAASNSSSGSYRYKRNKLKNPRQVSSKMNWYAAEEAPW